MKRGRRILLLALAAIVATPLAVVLYSEQFGWNWARPWIERSLAGATGRDVEIAGDLDVDLGLRPRVTAEGMKLANAKWGGNPQMFTAASGAVRFRLLPLLIGRVRLDELALDRASLLLEVDEEGRANWSFDDGERRSKGEKGLALPGEISVRASSVGYFNKATGDKIDVDFETLEARSGEQLDLRFAARGRYQDLPMEARGVAGAIEQLRAGDPYPLRAEARVGETRARVVGLIQKPKELDGVNLDLRLEGKSLADLWPIVGLPLAETPPYRLAGRLRRDGETWGLYDFDGALGKSDLGGRLAVTLREERRPLLRAALRSKALDLDDVEGFWGREVAEEKKGAKPKGPIFSDKPFSFAKLHAMDAAVDFRAGTVKGRSMLDDVRLGLALEGGRLQLDPLDLGFAGGRLTSHATIDARAKPAKLAGDIVLRSIDLKRLLQEAEIDRPGFGTVGGRAELKTAGSSLRAMASNLDGDLGVLMQNGELSETLIELAALDLGEYLVRRVKGDDAVPIRCLVGTFGIDDGRMTAETLLMDTRVDRIVGEGTIDLAKEEIDLRLYEHPRRATLGSLASPILIEGSFADRKVRLDRKGLFKRGGAAVLLGALVHPAAALLALVELEGDEEPGACSAAFKDYQQIAATDDRARQRQTSKSASSKSKPGAPSR
jgi:uncharacterized protein involved in outer membrane biogenesis